jgi:hypothetical protein
MMFSFHVDPKGQPVDPTATQIDTISSAEQTSASIELDLATPRTFTAPATTSDLTRAGASRLNYLTCPRLSIGEPDIVQIPGQRPVTFERLDEQVTCCLLPQSIENTGISENVAGSRRSQNLFQLQTIILSSFLDNSPCKVSKYFEP